MNFLKNKNNWKKLKIKKIKKFNKKRILKLKNKAKKNNRL
jgi:hypothetical protein